MNRLSPLVLLASFATASAQSPSAPLVAGPVELAKQPDAVKDKIEAFPHVVAGPAVTAAVADRINAALVRADARARTASADCDAMLKDNHIQDDEGWTRTIDVTMRGPRFLSFNAIDSYSCGGPYPTMGLEMPLVYDLTTGLPVNWIKLLPAGARAKRNNGADGTITGELVWPAMRREGVRSAEKDCKDAWDSYPDMTFAAFPDARLGALVLQPTEFPHALMACADAMPLEPATLRRIKASPELIDALEAAHTLQPKKPTPAKK